jgi:hypothetical protein
VLLGDIYADALTAQGLPAGVLTDLELRGDDPRLVAEGWLRAQGLASAGEALR